MTRYKLPSWELEREKAHLPKATITGKRQITVPKEIADKYKFEGGDRILFRNVNGKVYIEPENENVNCSVCDSTGLIAGKNCFVCQGQGYLEGFYLSSGLRLMGHICLSAFGNKLFMEYGYKTNEQGENIYPFPIITIKSDNYPKNIVDRVQDWIQLDYIKYIVSKGFSLYDSEYAPILKKKILEVLVTDDYKKEALMWMDSVDYSF